MKICDRCGNTNTEFSEFTMKVDLSPLKDRLRRFLLRYINKLLGAELEVDVKICQTCQSKMFRKLDKEV